MIEIVVSRGNAEVPVLLDDTDAARIPGRLRIGSHGYAHFMEGGRQVLVHRWILGLAPGDGKVGDHINLNRLDNRRCNLRVTTRSGNRANVRARGVSGFRGVYPRENGRWIARGCPPNYGRPVHLGTFDTAEEAAYVAHLWRAANLPDYLPTSAGET